MIPREFEYHAPKTIPDALGLLKQLGDEAKLLAGGHSLLPMMKMRFARPGQDGRKPDSRTALGNSGGGRKLHQPRLRVGREHCESDAHREIRRRVLLLLL